MKRGRYQKALGQRSKHLALYLGDDKLNGELLDQARERGVSMSRLLNDLVRAGLAKTSPVRGQPNV